MRKILVIAELEGSRHLLIEQIDRRGFVAVSAPTTDGVKAARAEKPDLIVMDFMMPRIDGVKATQMLRAHPETSDIPILVTSALSGGSDVTACMDAGCTGYLTKPFTSRELETKIHELLK